MGVVMDITPKGGENTELLNKILERDTTVTELTLSCSELGNSALRGMSALEKIHLTTATSIEAQAMQNCSHLREIYLEYNGVVSLANTNAIPVAQTANTIKILVPSREILNYKTATNWSTLYEDGDIDIVSLP